jgi:DinB family protein
MAREPNAFIPSESLVAAEAIEQDLRRLAAALTDDQFNAPTPTGGWSVAHCIEHMVLAGHAFLPKWDLALKEAGTKRLYGTAPFPYSLWYRFVLRALEPPYTIKTKTTRSLTPYSRPSIEDALRYFMVMHRELTRRIGLSVGLDASRARVQSPFVSWIWYPLGFSFDFALTHERRHLWQAWQVLHHFRNRETATENSFQRKETIGVTL